MGISARVVLDSRHPGGGPRVTTIETTGFRFTQAEKKTHRMLAGNAASSRAVPVSKMLGVVMAEPAVPVEWRYNQSGMEGGDFLTPDEEAEAIRLWLQARDAAHLYATMLSNLNVHKSIANRLLEPFGWITNVFTGTDDPRSWPNFFGLRCSPRAQPELRVEAEAIRVAYEASMPQDVGWGDYHLPYVQGYDLFDMLEEWGEGEGYENAKRISAARCAAVSYLRQGQIRDWSKDLELFENLLHPKDSPPHASPFEHVCTPARSYALGCLDGWVQYRHELGLL